LKRAYYDCDRCHHGFCPRDRALKLESFSLTPGVLRMTASAAALVSFEESGALLHELAGVEVSVKQVERAAEALGAEIAVDERQDVERMREVAPTIYLGLDGTGSARKKSQTARASKPTARAKTREAKLAISYSSAIESAATPDTSPRLSDFAARVQREASRRGFTEGLRQVVLGDGSTWIWNTATELFPQATQILDRFHAKEHLGEVGKVIYGDSPEGKAWIDARCEELDEGHLKSLVHALRSHIGQHKEARECIQYIWRNRRRMRYPQFEKQGFCTSTGVVESGCKLVVGTRLKRAGMHWTVKGANAIIALRCSKLSGRFQDFWERRSERKQVAA
jgi:hypothetical protein